MKIWLPSNPWWYIAVFVFLGPYLLISTLDPEWLIRLLSITIFQITVIIFVLLHGISKQASDSDWRLSNPPFAKYFGGVENVRIIERILLVIISIVVAIIFIPPLIKDGIAITKDEAPLTRSGTVTSTRNLLIGEITLDSSISNSDNTFDIWFFPPRQIIAGNTYEFLYLPNTRYILEARLIRDQ